MFSAYKEMIYYSKGIIKKLVKAKILFKIVKL